MCVSVCVCVSAGVCVREREGEKERESLTLGLESLRRTLQMHQDVDHLACAFVFVFLGSPISEVSSLRCDRPVRMAGRGFLYPSPQCKQAHRSKPSTTLKLAHLAGKTSSNC